MINIAVSGINAMDNPGPGAGIIRALKESPLDVRTIGLAYDSMEPGIYMDHIVDKSYLMPYPSVAREVFFERLRYIHSVERLDMIISALDAELPVYMNLESDLNALGIQMLIPSRQMFERRNKSRLKELAGDIGVKCPKYIVCNSRNALDKAVKKIGFPCMIKGPFYEAFKAGSSWEAGEHFQKIVCKWGYPVIVQQYVYGQEYDVVGCGDGNGGDLGLFAMKKMTTTSLGKVWNAVSVADTRLLNAAKKLVDRLSWRGGFELEVLVEEKTRDIVLLEVNPRFPAWVYMAAACGINLPERMVRFLAEMPYESHSNYQSGKIMIRYTNEVIKDISDFEQAASLGELENRPVFREERKEAA